MPFQKYKDLEPIRRLLNEGRELLGEFVALTEKRDGENVQLSLDENNEVKVGSRRQEEPDPHIENRMKAVPEYAKARELLIDALQYDDHYILYGELLKTISPTRIEPRRKHCHWILFDIWDIDAKRFLSYDAMYQKAFHFKIPVVKCLDFFSPKTLEELQQHIDVQLKWCRRHRREGVVGKCYSKDTFFKEKIDLPKRPKLERPAKSDINYPPMPPETIQRALDHAYDACLKAGHDWKDRAKAMPLVAAHLSNEASEHNYKVPPNFYNLYLDYKPTVLESHDIYLVFVGRWRSP